MKKGLIILFVFVFSSISLVNAACELDASMINQDPYPAVPGNYVKLVFQITGTENPECGRISIELLEKYPISFDPGESSLVQIRGGTYQRDYSSYLIVPYKVRLDENALNGENKIEVRFGKGNLSESYKSKSFNIEVEDTHADFEIFIKAYDAKTKKLTFEILNIAESNVEALTLEIPKQDNITILGSKTNILGDLDSNEYTTADFTATPKQGEITIKISYSDAINKRRTIEKKVLFEPEYFKPSDADQKKPWYVYLIYILIAGAVVYFFYRHRKKKKERYGHHIRRHH
ncbi:MAG TPA: hypothetical protein ENG87_02435 [Candidatus Pacearchaeota archaeon]|nr:hypothetical protein BMS3Abin17_00490 [archaeon BMS3Abin17]HDK42213.1 hypothetical protein [Candidatus Pacearchaeota archaeon]HDZ61071.1 hypothetical protein [Candidatus Pacearchaeota archaeon]